MHVIIVGKLMPGLGWVADLMKAWSNVIKGKTLYQRVILRLLNLCSAKCALLTCLTTCATMSHHISKHVCTKLYGSNGLDFRQQDVLYHLYLYIMCELWASSFFSFQYTLPYITVENLMLNLVHNRNIWKYKTRLYLPCKKKLRISDVVKPALNN